MRSMVITYKNTRSFEQREKSYMMEKSILAEEKGLSRPEIKLG